MLITISSFKVIYFYVLVSNFYYDLFIQTEFFENTIDLEMRIETKTKQLDVVYVY